MTDNKVTDIRRTRAERAIAMMAEGSTIADTAEVCDLTYRAVQGIRVGRSWPDLPRPTAWPSNHPQKLNDSLATAIIARAAAGEDLAEITMTCGAEVTIASVYNILAGRTYKHLSRPERMPKVEQQKKDPRPRYPGEKNPNARLTEVEVKAITSELLDGRGTTTRAQKAMGREYEVHYMTIRAIARGETWRHITGFPKLEKGEKYAI